MCSTLWTKLLTSEIERIDTMSSSRKRQLLGPLPTCDDDASSAYYSHVHNYLESESSNEFRRILALINDLQQGRVDMKSNDKAERFRLAGNECFKNGDLEGAGEAYRRGLLHCPNVFPVDGSAPVDFTPTDLAHYLHGNLSLIMARQSEWHACVWHCLLALKLLLNNRRELLTAKQIEFQTRVWKRLVDACGRIQFNKNPPPQHCPVNLDDPDCDDWIDRAYAWFRTRTLDGQGHSLSSEGDSCDLIPTPCYGHHAKLPGLSRGLRVDSSSTKGRHLVATRPFHPGDVVAVEPAGGWLAFNSSSSSRRHEPSSVDARFAPLYSDRRASHCTFCLSPFTSVGYVCPQCPYAAYCGPPSNCYSRRMASISCRDSNNFNPRWHNEECCFTFLLDSTQAGLACFRLTNPLMPYLLSRSSTDESPTNANHLPTPTLTDLCDHLTDFQPRDRFQLAATGWLLAKLLLFKQSANQPLEKVGLWCFNLLRRLQLNSQTLFEVGPFGPRVAKSINRFVQRRLSSALFPSTSLFNHSCDPNVLNCGGEGPFIVLRADRTINPSDECTICYGPNVLDQPNRRRRIEQLLSEYFFTCSCPQCCSKISSEEDDKLTNVDSAGGSVAERKQAWTDAIERAHCLVKNPVSQQSPTSIATLVQAAHNAWCCRQQQGQGHSNCSCWPSDDDDDEYRPWTLWSDLGAPFLSSSQVDQSSSRILGIWCLAQSTRLVAGHYGQMSSAHFWHLLLLGRLLNEQSSVALSELKSIDLSSNNNEISGYTEKDPLPSDWPTLISDLKRIGSIHFGPDKCRRIVRRWLGDGRVCDDFGT